MIYKKCNCQYHYQDAKYGFGVRLMNLRKGGKEARCTVCGTIHKL